MDDRAPDEDFETAGMNDQNTRELDPAPTKVCAKCSVQTQTSGDFCPSCGNSYITRTRRPGRKAVIAMVAAVAVLAVTAAGLTLKGQHDRAQAQEAAAAANKAAVEKAAADKAAAEKAAADKAAAEKAAATKAAAVKAAAQQAERDDRADLIRQMQKSITNDAKERVADGELDGPIYYTTCDPLGGGSADDLTALTTTFECLAVNEKLGEGRVRGWVFSATANWDKGSWSWSLGS